MKERIDKIISNNTSFSRREVDSLIKKGSVFVDNTLITSSKVKVDREVSQIVVDGVEIKKRGKIVVMMNKKKGYVTSLSDPISPTVMELLPEEYRECGLVPIGRLDKDTEGLLLFTNDGELNHTLTSPKKNIEKIYYVEHLGEVKEEDILAFKNGIELKDGKCKSAVLRVIEKGKAELTITEGRFHEVKRMMAKCGLKVTYLKRIEVKGIKLGPLKLGESRELSNEEYKGLYS